MDTHAISLLLIDSKDRDGEDPVNDFSMSREGAQFNMLNVRRYAVKAINFKWTMKTVNERNNMLFIRDNTDTTVHSITIPTGHYNAIQLATILQTTMQAAANWTPVWPIAQNPGRFLLTYNTAGPNYNFTVLTVDTADRPIDWELVNNPNGNRSIINILNPDVRTSTISIINPPALVYTYNCGFPNFLPTEYIDIISAEINTYNPPMDESSNPKVTNVIERIFPAISSVPPLTQPGFGVHLPHYVTYEVTNLKWMSYVPSRSLGTVRIQVLDDEGNLAPMTDEGENFQITLLCESR